MQAYVGLGNPGDKYQNNRHNVGYMAIDYMIEKITPCVTWESKPKLQSQIVKLDNSLYVKPQTFMNSSGLAAKKLVDYYKINLEDLYVFYDDLDIRLGEYKIQKGKAPHEHNGVLSINKNLGSLDFWHVRIGVDSRDSNNPVSGLEYVLQNFLTSELEIIQKTFAKIYKDLYE